jgi:ABC-type Fe3+-citrate transport system substrate-binding protein
MVVVVVLVVVVMGCGKKDNQSINQCTTIDSNCAVQK